jgi:hypothetical protein
MMNFIVLKAVVVALPSISLKLPNDEVYDELRIHNWSGKIVSLKT